jgi:hypothetical protein
MSAVRGMLRLVAVLALATGWLTGPTLVGLVPAMAAVGERCFIETSLQPGLLNDSDECVYDDTFPEGSQCTTTGLYFNGAAAQCVANNAICSTPDGPGAYQNGSCQALPQPPTPEAPSSPDGFGDMADAGALPGGDLQPMCVNASPFIGGGMFVVSGTVICYNGAGKDSGIYAYTDGPGGAQWNPFDPTTWDSLMMRDLYASDDITAEGTLSVFGGGRIYSANGKNGLQVDDEGVLIRSADGANIAGVGTTPGNVTIAATNGTTTSSIDVDGTDGIDIIGNVATNGPGVSIAGGIGSGNTSRIGVGITGDGQGDATAPTSGLAPWADVQIGSKSFTQSNGLGAGVIVNDHGVASGVGNATSTVMIQGALDHSARQGTSILTGANDPVSGGSSTVMYGASARHIVTDSNGRMTIINGAASEATSSMYVVNGYGNTNGVVVTERTAVVSGGTESPTSLTFSDNGAHFSNGTNGAPVRLSGIANGSGPMDAANIRQLHAGLASVAALTGLPAPQAGKDNSFGMALGQNGSGSAVALGGQSLLGEALTVKYGAALAYSAGHVDSTATLGIGFSW